MVGTTKELYTNRFVTIFLGYMSLVWYFQANTLNTFTVSLYKTSRGLRSIYLQKYSHFVYCPLVAAVVTDLLVYGSLVVPTTTARNISQKLLHLVGSAASVAASVGN